MTEGITVTVTENPVSVLIGQAQSCIIEVAGMGPQGPAGSGAGGLVPEEYDSVEINYDVDGYVSTAEYLLDGVLVVTVTLHWTDGILTSVTRS